MTSKLKGICPKDHTKDELVELAVANLGMTSTKAARMTKPILCECLSRSLTPSACEKKFKDYQEGKVESKAKGTVVKKVPAKVKISPSPIRSPKPPKPKSSVGPRKPCIERSDMPLFEHQIRVVNHMRKHRGLIVSHDVGSGKTLTAVTAAECFLEDHPLGKVIVVTPVSLQENFKKEMRTYGVDDGSHYEFWTLAGFAKAYNTKRCGSNVMLIVDEAHNLRTNILSAKRAGAKRDVGVGRREHVVRADVALRCAMTAEKVLLLTATSIYNNPRDLINLVSMVKGQRIPTQKQFEQIMENPLEFKRYFACVLSFYDIPTDENYPTLKEHDVKIEMSPSYYREYRNVEKRNSHLFSRSNPWSFLTGVRQASNALTECPKCDWVLAEAIDGESKMLIYSAFKTYGIRQIQDLFNRVGISYVEITGSMNKIQRKNAVDMYNSDEVRIMFITKAGGEGLDLKGTQKVIIFESAWNKATENQIIGRAVRYKSHAHLPPKERHVDAYHLLMVKPPMTASYREADDRTFSADIILRGLIEEKEKVNRGVLKRLYPLSIEQQKC